MDAHPETTRPSSPDAYEFKDVEERVIGRTARWAANWSWVALFLGVLLAVAGIAGLPTGFGSLALGLVFILIGFSFRGAAASLRDVVSTTGSDLVHLTRAMERLTTALRAQAVLILLAVALGFLWGLTLGAGAGP